VMIATTAITDSTIRVRLTCRAVTINAAPTLRRALTPGIVTCAKVTGRTCRVGES
jgi:hypothetical protein